MSQTELLMALYKCVVKGQLDDGENLVDAFSEIERLIEEEVPEVIKRELRLEVLTFGP